MSRGRSSLPPAGGSIAAHVAEADPHTQYTRRAVVENVTRGWNFTVPVGEPFEVQATVGENGAIQTWSDSGGVVKASVAFNGHMFVELLCFQGAHQVITRSGATSQVKAGVGGDIQFITDAGVAAFKNSTGLFNVLNGMQANEQSSPPDTGAGVGTFYVRDTTPTKPRFVDSSNVDHPLAMLNVAQVWTAVQAFSSITLTTDLDIAHGGTGASDAETARSNLGALAAVDIDTLAELNVIIADATLINTTDSRLSDARFPLAHTHAAVDVISGTFANARISETSVTQHFPINDTSGLVKGSADGTKVVRIEADGLTTSTTRVITMPDANLTLMGGFTTGSVVFSGSAGNPAQANSNFFWDNTAKRLGVGTPTPNAPMDVTGVTPGVVGGFASGTMHVTSSSALVNANAVITGHNKFGGNKQLWYLGSTSSSDDGIAFINRQNAPVVFYTNNTPRFTIAADGDITLEKTITIKGGVPTAGRVLTSVDTTGAATWEPPVAGGATLFGVSTATQSFASDDALADVTSLSIAIAANEEMHVKIVLYVSTGIGGLKLALNGPVGFTSLHYIVQPTKTTGVGTAGLHTAYNSSTGESSSTLIAMELHAIIINGGTAGNIVARAAQESSNVSSSDILRDSFISGDVIP